MTLPDVHRRFLDVALPTLAADPRILGVAAAGSYASGAMDALSDLDLALVLAPDARAAWHAEGWAQAAKLGESPPWAVRDLLRCAA